jgi:pimeloyl-ACP methyl ester carboxylesterase
MSQVNRIRGMQGGAAFAPPALLFDGIRTRAALVAEKRPEGVRGPPIRHLLREIDALAAPIRRLGGTMEMAPAAEPRVVVLMPGFGTHPVRMRHMARKLEEAGHTVKRWGLGFNFGPSERNFELLNARVAELHERYGEKLYLVGWSLGGLFAREVAKLQPDAVAKVVTMGSPFSGDGHANNVWRVYHLITGHSVNNPPVGKDRAAKPPVPTVALWSPRDGMIHPRAASGKPGERDRAVALRCSHLGFAYSDEAIAAVMRELERAE